MRGYDTAVTLRQLFTDAAADYWDQDAYDAAIEREAEERAALGMS